MLTDITERTLAEANAPSWRINSGRRRNWRAMAGSQGGAHDLTMLTVINGYSELLLKD
jgi:hypothetical protein